MPTTKPVARLAANVTPSINSTTKKSLRFARSIMVSASWLPANSSKIPKTDSVSRYITARDSLPKTTAKILKEAIQFGKEQGVVTRSVIRTAHRIHDGIIQAAVSEKVARYSQPPMMIAKRYEGPVKSIRKKVIG